MTLHKFTYRHDEACYLGERYPQQEITIQSSCDDLHADELLQLFKSYMMACGYAEKSFYEACETAADENNPYRKGGNRYELGQTDQIRHTTYSNPKDHIPVKDTNPIKDLFA